MKKLQKLLFGVAFTLAVAAVGAQTSKTFSATSGTFKTDVDNFMDVNNWSTVNPKNLFACSGLYSTGLDLGFAKQFHNKKNNFYLGAYYNGNLWGDTTSESDKNGDNKTNTDNADNEFDAFFGFGLWGIKLSTSFSNNKTVKTVTTTTTTNDYSDFSIGLSAGTTLKTKKMDLTPYASINFYNNGYKEIVESDSPTETTDNSVGTLSFNLGTGIPLKSNKTIKQALNIPLTLSFNTYPKYYKEGNNHSTTIEESNFTLNFEPSYFVETKPADNVSVNAKATLPIYFSTFHKGNTESVLNGTTTKTEGDYTFNKFTLYPRLNAGLQYTVKPEKFIINFGLGVSLPSFTLSVEEDKKSDPTTKKTNTKTNNASTLVTSGFTYFFTKNICADTYMSILSTSDSGVKTSLSTIWTSSLYFGLSVKY